MSAERLLVGSRNSLLLLFVVGDHRGDHFQACDGLPSKLGGRELSPVGIDSYLPWHCQGFATCPRPRVISGYRTASSTPSAVSRV